MNPAPHPRRSKIRKRTIVLLFLALAILVATVLVLASTAAPGENAPGFQDVVVGEESLQADIEVSGNILPLREQNILAPGDGIITGIFVQEGELVRQGKLLGKLDDTLESYELKQQRYAIDAEAWTGNRRRQALLEEEYKVKLANLQRRQFTALFNGKLTRLGRKDGDFMKAGELFARVIDTSVLKARVEIFENDFPRLAPGQSVKFQFPALPGVEAQGTVSFLGSEGRINDRGVTVFDAELQIPQPPKEVLPPFSFVATITTGEPQKILVLDAMAITMVEGKATVTQVSADGSTREAAVKISPLGPGRVRLLEGLQAGDTVRLPATAAMPGAMP